MEAVNVSRTLDSTSETTESLARDLYQEMGLAYQDLQRTTVKQRVAEVQKVIDFVVQNKEMIVDRICEETGKTRTDALVSEVLGTLDYLEWLEHKAAKVLSDEKASTPLTLMGKKSRIYHEALGTVLVIAPWNYPFHIGLTSIIGAFVAGNATIFKPSEHTPLKGLFEDIIAQSPLMRNSIKVIYGTGVTAQRLIAQGPAKIFFTGSAPTGRKILQQAAEHFIPVELELGGKDAMIVFEDVNLKRTVAGALWGALTNSGQSCTSVEKLYVHESIYDQFVAELRQEAAKLVVNSGDHGDADMGGITVDFQMDIIKRHVEDAKKKGANIITGGEVLNEAGRYFMPTILTDVTEDMAVFQEETFGPLIPVFKFSTEQEVINTTNAWEFGLSASVWSKDLDRADRVSRALQVGAVSINNVMLTEGNPDLPFGGAKASGYGRVKGAEGLLGYTRSKAILIDKQSDKIEANWYPYTHKKYQHFKALIDALFSKGPLKLIKVAIAGMLLENEAQKPR